MTTIAIQIKEKMANMPDTLNTKKGIETYFKDIMKNTETDKPKRELTAYQQYVKDNSKSVKEQNKDMTGTEVLSLVAKMWKASQNGNNAKPVKEEDKAPDIKIEEDKAPDIKIEEVKAPDIKIEEVKAPDTEIEEVKPHDVKAKKKK